MTHPRNRHVLSIILLFAAAAHSVAMAGVALAEPTDQSKRTTDRTQTILLKPLVDTYVDQGSAADRCGSAELLVGGTYFESTTYNQRSLLRFDLSTIPADARIEEAKLRLSLSGSSGGGSLEIGAYRIEERWFCSPNLNWISQPDRGARHASLGVGSSTNAAYSWDLTGLAAQWHAGSANHGLLLRAENEQVSRTRRFHSADATQGTGPELRITYRRGQPTSPAPTPTASGPATLDLWLVEGCGRDFPIGASLSLRLRASQTGRVVVERRPGGITLVDQEIDAGRTYGLPPGRIGAPAGARELIGRLYVLGQLAAVERCSYYVVEPSATPAPPTTEPTATPRRETFTPTPTRTLTPTPTVTLTPTPTRRTTPSGPSPTPTITMTPVLPGPSQTPTTTLTPTPTRPKPSPTPTLTSTPAGPSATPAIRLTPTQPTSTPTVTLTPTPTRPLPSHTITLTPTPTRPSPTPTPTLIPVELSPTPTPAVHSGRARIYLPGLRR